MSPRITCSELALLLFLQTQIGLSRARLGEDSFGTLALCFLLQHIHFLPSPSSSSSSSSSSSFHGAVCEGSCTQFASLHDFMTQVSESIVDCPIAIQYLYENIDITSLDDLFSFFHDLRANIFSEVDENTSGLSGPNLVEADSLLGFFVRSLIITFESNDFEQVCALFEEFSHFKDRNFIATSPGLSSLCPLKTSKDSFSDTVTEKLLHFDTYNAVEYVHTFFDSLPSSASTCSSSSSSSNNASRRQLFHASMLTSHALVHLQSRYLHTAKLSLDELITIAHSRNDHEAIAQAMELLFHILSTGEIEGKGIPLNAFSKDGSSSKKELLLLCIKKYVSIENSSKLPAMTAACHLALYMLRSSPASSAFASSFLYIWSLLSAASFGDASTLKRVLEASSGRQAWDAVASLDLASSSGSSIPLSESAELRSLCHFAEAELWFSEGSLPEVALLQYQRALRGPVSRFSSEILVQYLRLKITTALDYFLFSQPENVIASCLDAAMEQCNEAAVLLAKWKERAVGFSNDTLVNRWLYLEIFISTCRFLLQGEGDMALMGTNVLLDLALRQPSPKLSKLETKILLCKILWQQKAEIEALKTLYLTEMEAKNAGLEGVVRTTNRLRLQLSSGGPSSMNFINAVLKGTNV